ncbi:hypothetical protein [Dietzia sp. 179-F 9C3 NHS]|uniref:hypothetical protein n=1 Tax=Dietzia sp. 179-F 9C3 NHS TaxID=3374295 RepID=UPI0038792D22
MGKALGAQPPKDDLKDFVPSRESVRNTPLTPVPDEPDPPTAAEAAAPATAKPAKAAGKPKRRHYTFTPELSKRILEVKARWLMDDQTGRRMFDYSQTMSENAFVACLLAYGLDSLEKSIKDGNDPRSLNARLPQYLPANLRRNQ